MSVVTATVRGMQQPEQSLDRTTDLDAAGDAAGDVAGDAAALAVLATIESEGLIEHAVEAGEDLVDRIGALDHPLVAGVRGAGLLRGIHLTRPIAPAAAAAARAQGFIVNPVATDALRLAPPLIITTDQLGTFVEALPAILDQAAKESA